MVLSVTPNSLSGAGWLRAGVFRASLKAFCDSAGGRLFQVAGPRRVHLVEFGK